MSRTRKSTSLIWVAIFVALVGIGRLALAATGNFHNPFSVFTQSAGGGGERGPRLENIGANGTGTTAPAPARPEGGAEGMGGDKDSISWSQLGQVLYNVWFIMAATAALIVAQMIINPVVKALKRLRPRVKQASLA